MSLERFNQPTRQRLQQVARLVHLKAEAERQRLQQVARLVHLKAEAEPTLPKDSMKVSAQAGAAGQAQDTAHAACHAALAAAQAPPAGRPAVQQAGQAPTHGDLVFRGKANGVAEGDMISYVPGRESGGWGPTQVADNGSFPGPGRGNRRPAPPSVFV